MELHVISQSEQQVEDLITLWPKVAPWVDYFHLRFKHKKPEECYQIGKKLIDTQSIAPASLIVNTHIQVAKQLKCNGIHLPESTLIDQHLNGWRWGRSVHSVESAIQAEQEGAAYIMFGHVFSSASKPGVSPRGVQALEQVVQAVTIPVIAVGGITPMNVCDVMKTGCAGIAVISALMLGDPQVVVQELKRRGQDD